MCDVKIEESSGGNSISKSEGNKVVLKCTKVILEVCVNHGKRTVKSQDYTV